MKMREFERWVRGWSRGLGHTWTVSSVDTLFASGRRALVRAMTCSGCGARMRSHPHPKLANFLVPAARYSYYTWRMIRLKSPNGKDLFVDGGVQSPKFPRAFRRLASPCSDITAAKTVFLLHVE